MPMTMALTLTLGLRRAVAERNWSRVWRWNSSGKTWVITRHTAISALLLSSIILLLARGQCTLKQILLGKHIPALHNLLQQRGQYDILVCLEVDKLTQSYEIAANKELQFFALLDALVTFAGVALVL